MARIGVDVHAAKVEDIWAQSFGADVDCGLGPFGILRVGAVAIYLSDSKVVDALKRAVDEIRAGMERVEPELVSA